MISFLNHHGYYFNDSEFSNYNYENHFSTNNYNCGLNRNYEQSRFEYNYNRHFDYNYEPFRSPNNINYNYEQYRSGTSRRQRNRRLLKERSSNNLNNQPTKLDTENCKALVEANLKKGLETKIEEGNKGFELLKKMGYENGKGLGKNEEGILEPIMLEKKSDRKGLGASSATNAVAVKHNLTKKQRKKLNREEARKQEQSAQKSKQQDKIAVEATAQQAEKLKQQHEVDKKAIVTSKSTENLKEETEFIKNPLSASKQVVEVRPVTAENSISVCNLNNNKVKFSVKDPCTPEFISSLGHTFNSEIELMQLRLIAEASLNEVHADNDLIVAKIYIENNANVADHVFEFIRTELVGWIGVYQQEGLDTPIFHSLTNNKSHITIVCDNLYAFECLERCAEDILKMETMGSLKVLRLPPITSLIYCFDAKYEGLASDSGLFLSQLHLHKPKLCSENWVVASHEVCPEERITYFIFLIDERSALALNFHYSRSFYICMQQVTFRNRGIVRETISN